MNKNNCLLCGCPKYQIGTIVENSEGKKFEILNSELTFFKDLHTNITYVDWDYLEKGNIKKVFKLKVIKQIEHE